MVGGWRVGGDVCGGGECVMVFGGGTGGVLELGC